MQRRLEALTGHPWRATDGGAETRGRGRRLLARGEEIEARRLFVLRLVCGLPGRTGAISSRGNWGLIIADREDQVLRQLREFVTHYNRHRTHSTLDGEPPEGLRGPPFPGRRLKSIPVCGG